MNNKKVLHYRTKYQDCNVAIIQFSKDDIPNFLKNSFVVIENGEDLSSFWECFEDALMETFGVAFVIIDDYKITVIKDPELPNWDRIIEDVIWISVFFLKPNGGAVEVSKNGKTIGKLITQKFDAIEPQYWRKKQ
ncbi:MAG: hypothetical protein HW401_301 [Parcubacteria group bacterium]|nr:hypothetical protein [Parcubacteria group bacterium]